jgi:hypothetical protein
MLFLQPRLRGRSLPDGAALKDRMVTVGMFAFSRRKPRPLHLRPRPVAVRTIPFVAALLVALLQCVSLGRAEEQSNALNQNIWTCSYIAATPRGPLQITAKFQVLGDELAEIETIPQSLNFNERYKILEDTETDIVAAISITKFGDDPPPGIGAVVVIIAKQNGLFQQSGSILGLHVGAPTLGHCDKQ